MPVPRITRTQRLSIVIGISFCFFATEIAVGFKTRSIALVADAFHYLNDLIGFVVALVALKISERSESPNSLSFGWQRSQLLGAFFNGVFLLALGVSIFLQAIDRFISLQRVEKPMLVLIVGCIGLTLNIISAFFLHEHEHDHDHGNGAEEFNTIELDGTNQITATHLNHRHITAPTIKAKGHDLGLMGVLVHVIGDAINNIGVIIAALVIWLAKFEGRFYADPGVSLGISLLILASAIPLVKNSGSILLESVPLGVNIEDVKHDLEAVPGVTSVHELHVWRLDQKTNIASAHISTTESSLAKFMNSAKSISECLHAYGIHSVTIQPELTALVGEETNEQISQDGQSVRRRQANLPNCQISCGSGCEPLTCCG